MSILAQLERRGNPLEDPNMSITDPAWWSWATGGIETVAGVKINEQSALGVSAFFAGVRFISETIGSLPCKLYRRSDRGRETVSDPRAQILGSVANKQMTAGVLREAMQGHLLTWGNAYAEIVKNSAGGIEELWPLPPSVTERKVIDGKVVFDVNVDGNVVRLPADKVLHIPGFGYDGRTGYSIVQLARESLGLSKAGEIAASKLFGSGLQASGILTTPATPTEKTRAALKKSIETQVGGLSNRQRLLILEGGLKFEQMGIPPGDAQFLESRQFSVVEVARWLNLPPHILKDLTHATFTNIEAQGLELVTYTLRPWFVRWEQHLNKALLTEDDLYFKIEDKALLRGDTAMRGQFYRERFQLGSISPNEVRALEDDNPVPGGDQLFVNAAMIPLDQANQMTVADRVRILAAAKGTEVPVVGTTNPTREWSREAWSRLVKGELRNVRQIVKHGGSLTDYYQGEFMEFGRKVLGPVFRAMDRDVDEALKDYGTDALRTFADVTPEQIGPLLDSWQDRVGEWTS